MVQTKITRPRPACYQYGNAWQKFCFKSFAIFALMSHRTYGNYYIVFLVYLQVINNFPLNYHFSWNIASFRSSHYIILLIIYSGISMRFPIILFVSSCCSLKELWIVTLVSRFCCSTNIWMVFLKSRCWNFMAIWFILLVSNYRSSVDYWIKFYHSYIPI